MLPDQTKLYIGGDFVSPEDGQVFETVDPSTNTVLTTVARGRTADIDRAVSAAWEAYNSSWSEAQASKRQRILLYIADTIDEHSTELAQLETLDNGKPISEAIGNVRGAAEQF